MNICARLCFVVLTLSYVSAQVPGFYNLQLYSWRVRSHFFDSNTCGNYWLDFYNACSSAGYFPGGIGFCGKWGSTVDRMAQCGTEAGNGSITESIMRNFCDCLQCTFVPAATSTEYPYSYLDNQTCAGVPTFESAVLDLADTVCGSRECHRSSATIAAAPTWFLVALPLVGAWVSLT
eukprot:INCI13040.1.p1 GENE.INCI13040.1~~INCI13040.1.p1  ORF type:complete len:177 (-),score=19.76 INCI13040.1:1386-1916(-)